MTQKTNEILTTKDAKDANAFPCSSVPSVDKKTAPLITFRPAQEEFFWCPARHAVALWRRQFGKSYTLGNWALKEMGDMPGCSVFFASAAIALGTENIRKEAEVWASMLVKMKAEQGERLTTSADDDDGNLLDVDAIADMFESSKLEAKLWFDHTTFSRSRVVAPNPATAVGWTGHIVLDEFGRIPHLQDVIEAMEPFMSSNPRFKWRWATTPPPQDDHYSWDLICPDSEEFPLNARGNWYRSKSGHLCHRVDVDDAFAGGVPMYHPETGAAITPDEHRALSFDKTAWDRNFRLKFIKGGLAALSQQSIFLAMERGKNECIGVDCREAVTL